MIEYASTTKTSGSKDNGREHQAEYTKTKEKIVDIFTKYLPRKTLEYLKQKLEMIPFPKGQVWKHQEMFPLPLTTKGEIKLKEASRKGEKEQHDDRRAWWQEKQAQHDDRGSKEYDWQSKIEDNDPDESRRRKWKWKKL